MALYHLIESILCLDSLSISEQDKLLIEHCISSNGRYGFSSPHQSILYYLAQQARLAQQAKVHYSESLTGSKVYDMQLSMWSSFYWFAWCS